MMGPELVLSLVALPLIVILVYNKPQPPKRPYNWEDDQ